MFGELISSYHYMTHGKKREKWQKYVDDRSQIIIVIFVQFFFIQKLTKNNHMGFIIQVFLSFSSLFSMRRVCIALFMHSPIITLIENYEIKIFNGTFNM